MAELLNPSIKPGVQHFPRNLTSFLDGSRPTSREMLFHVLNPLLISDYGIHPDISTGINSFMKRAFPNDFFHLGQIIGFAQDLSAITEGRNFFKSRSFNYLSENDDPTRVLNAALDNARFMVGMFGLDFFSRDERQSEKRKQIYRAAIPNTDLYLSAKGGTGAGTFSVDFAIGVNNAKGHFDTTGELWRTGFDTELQDDGTRRFRIIRTGSAVKQHAGKTEKFSEFKQRFKTTPSRVLTTLLLESAYEMGFVDVSALTSNGAETLSRSPFWICSYDYTQLFSDFGFVEEPNGLWMALPTTSDEQLKLPRPRSREQAGIRVLRNTFNDLADKTGELFPLKLAA